MSEKACVTLKLDAVAKERHPSLCVFMTGRTRAMHVPVEIIIPLFILASITATVNLLKRIRERCLPLEQVYREGEAVDTEDRVTMKMMKDHHAQDHHLP